MMNDDQMIFTQMELISNSPSSQIKIVLYRQSIIKSKNKIIKKAIDPLIYWF